MNVILRCFLLSLMLVVQPVLVSADEPALSAEELARALGVSWTTMTLPGTEDDIYYAGAVIEFGDGSKPIKSGMVGAVKGGSVVKFFVRREGGKLTTTVLAGEHSSSSSFEDVFEEYSTIMGISSDSAPRFSEIDYLIKGSRDPLASVGGPSQLKENEAGIRVHIELRNKK
ncbi:MAG: hypothetical protein P1U86_00625 [Verrucomicrobiales bacterium]|nr:hypothetical protein [Verrucomicrobiales bacterium]